LDSADTCTFNSSDFDVSCLSPNSTPGVSDDVVVLSGFGSVSDGGNGVVEGGSASGGVEDSSGVSLEDRGVSLNGDGDGLSGNGGHELSFGVGWNVLVSENVEESLRGVVFAGSLFGGVWVGSLKLGLVGLEVGEGVCLPSTVASVRGLVAVDDFLLGDGDEVSGLEEMSTLNTGNSSESPA
jgi:hypothetical protein